MISEGVGTAKGDHGAYEEVDLTRRLVKDAPPYDPDVPMTQEREQILHGYYGHTGYWPSAMKGGR